MKLTTIDDGSRDGQLAVVSRDLSTAHFAAGIAGRMQQVLDDWNFISPQLEDLYATLNDGKARHAFAFDPATSRAPLPRAFHWVTATAAARWLQHPGDDLPGPRPQVSHQDTTGGIALGIAAVTADVPRGASVDAGLDGVRLLMMVSEALADSGAAVTAFGPLAVTPDELGGGWHRGRVQLQMAARIGRRHLAPGESSDADTARSTAGAAPHVGELVAALAQARRLGAGTVIGCRLQHLWPTTVGGAWIQPGERLQVEWQDRHGGSVFGAVDWRLPAGALTESAATTLDASTGTPGPPAGRR